MVNKFAEEIRDSLDVLGRKFVGNENLINGKTVRMANILKIIKYREINRASEKWYR